MTPQQTLTAVINRAIANGAPVYIAQPPAPEYGLSYWIAQTMQTRHWGHTYVHAGARAAAQFSFRAFEHDGITFSFCSWGRSLSKGGHKYKVHARYSDNGKPVPAKVLKNLF